VTDTAKRTDELPLEGDPEEAAALVSRRPIEFPKHRLEHVHVAQLNVDYAPPNGNGYARPLSQGRLARLRRDWDPMACGPLVISRRSDDTLYVIDGNHRRVIAFEKGVQRLPALVFSGINRPREADLYTKLGTVFGQTPATRFQSKLVAGDKSARHIVKIVESYGLSIASGKYRETEIKAVARVEFIYARGGEEALNWVLGVLTEAYPQDSSALAEMILEGAFGFWWRYAKDVDQRQLAKILSGAGLTALHDRADSTFAKYDLGARSNTYGVAMSEMWTAATKKKLPKWERIVIGPPHDVERGEGGLFLPKYRSGTGYYRTAADPAPQHLSG
jgi:hypothetical protein